MNKDNSFVELCLLERQDALRNQSLGWIKKNGFDLSLKFIILLINSIGLKNIDGNSFLFVDEIKNSNMSNNLSETYDEFIKNDKQCNYLSFYKINRNKHFKIGVYTSIKIFICYLFGVLFLIIKALFKRDVLKDNMIYLNKYFRYYLEVIDKKKKIYIMMTDHHFFSAHIANYYEDQSIVLQHGLIYLQKFFEPRAGYIFVWGENSLEKINNKSKTIITGTYKFNRLIKLEKDFNQYQSENVLFCINSFDHDVVIRKVEAIYKACKELGKHLIVKCHPGSLFNDNYLMDYFSGTSIEFQKEISISDLKFNYAIMEDSTAILDVLLLKVPFMIFDDKPGYFGIYDQIIYRGDSTEAVCNFIRNIANNEIQKTYRVLTDKELNGNRCCILDEAERIKKDLLK